MVAFRYPATSNVESKYKEEMVRGTQLLGARPSGSRLDNDVDVTIK
jgi:hypothetical protein